MLPASAIGKPQAALVAIAWWIFTLRLVRNGIVRKPPPAPRKADSTPMRLPVPNRPAAEGSVRGSPSLPVVWPGRSILQADQPMKAAKKAAISRAGQRTDDLGAQQRADDDARAPAP